MQQKIIILDFGSQTTQLIGRRVRELDTFCEILPYNKFPKEELGSGSVIGVILSGSPFSVHDAEAFRVDLSQFVGRLPVLGICYGAQLMAYMGGGRVDGAKESSEYGNTELLADTKEGLLAGVPDKSIVWMSHQDYISEVPEGFSVTAHTVKCPCAAMADAEKKLYGVQFHPEVTHSEYGGQILKNFVYDVCGCKGDWQMSSFVDDTVAALREKIGSEHVLLGLSGGVDSAVTAALLSRAIGDQLHCVFVDHGMMRKNEGDEVEAAFGSKSGFNLHFIRVDAGERFFTRLVGQSDPETKRKIIGEEFPRVFADEARKLKGKVKYIAQGTIYPDVIESGKGGDVIKSHHNVGGLPIEVVRELGFDETPIEPLRMLFKDEVRRAGLELGIPEELVYRQPFPGPGLAVRIIGEVTPQKVKILQEASAIFRDELKMAGVDNSLGQYFAALTNMRSVGVMGDHRTYGLAVVLRAVNTTDFMTAEAANIPWDVLQSTMNRIINEVDGINRVLYDITSKPPGTIELE